MTRPTHGVDCTDSAALGGSTELVPRKPRIPDSDATTEPGVLSR